MPFAGIAFLWFIGVIRDLLGEYEDRFFSTVFLVVACCSVFFGSGLLFLAMVFVSSGVAGATLASAKLAATSEHRGADRVFRPCGHAAGK